MKSGPSGPDPARETADERQPMVSCDPSAELMRHRLLDPPTRPGLMASLGPYDILRQIGQGGMGVVLLARRRGQGELLAIKLMRPELAQNARAVHRFLSEARHMADLAHPNVLPILDICDRREGPYFVMPFLERGSLGAMIGPRVRVPPEQALRIALGVARALRFAHEKGITHRDLKPDNVLVDGQGQPYLADFGLARTTFNDSVVDVRASQREGTAPYMAPEIVRGEAGDTRCDIYSWGAMIYEVLSGRRPYEGASAQAVFDRVLAGPPEPLGPAAPDAPPGLVRVVEAAMARELRDRYASMADVVRDLERIDAGHAPLGPHGRAGAGGSRRVPVVLLVVVTAAALVGWWLRSGGWRGGPAPGPPSTADPVPAAAPAFSVARNLPAQSAESPIGVDSAGRLYLARDDAGPDGRSAGIYLHLLNADGTPRRQAVRVNTATEGRQWQARCAASKDGACVVVWLAPDGDDLGVFARWFDADGRPVGEPVAVNDDPAGEQVYCAVAMAADGATVITWQHTGYGVFARRFDRAGAPVGVAIRVNEDPEFYHWQPRVAVHRDNSLLFAWTTRMLDGDDDGVYARRFTADGRPMAPPFRVNTHVAGRQRNPVPAVAPDGGYLITWMSRDQDGDDWGCYGQFFDAADRKRGGELSVNQTTAGPQRFPSGAFAGDDRVVVVWDGVGRGDRDGLGIYGRVLDRSGRALGDEFLIGDPAAGDQVGPSLAARPDNTVAVAWIHQSTELRARVLTPAPARR